MNTNAPAQEPTQDSIAALLSELAGGRRVAVPAVGFERWEGGGEPRAPGASVAGANGRVTAAGRAGAPSPVEPLPAAPPPAVAYLLPGLPPEGSGGSHSLVQEARGLRELGAAASICVPAHSLTAAAALYGNEDGLFATYDSDPAFPGVSDSSLAGAVGGADVAVATEYPSVELLARLGPERPELVCAYYVQDYEPLFAPPGSSRSDRALLSYRAIPGQTLFAKTDWLRGVIAEMHGLPVAKVSPSLDRGLFHARGRAPGEGVLHVAAMVRPRTPRRRPAATLAAMESISAELGNAVRLFSFGCDRGELAELPAHGEIAGLEHLGLLGRREVAELMRRCDVFIDASAYQAFGRGGLEAMACGAVPVLPALGGVREYATHEENALVLADGSPATIAAEVIGLARDPGRLEAMREAGVRRAQDFSIERAAISQLELFAAITGRGHRPVVHGS